MKLLIQQDDNLVDAKETLFTELQQYPTVNKFLCVMCLQESSGAQNCEVCGYHIHIISGINSNKNEWYSA
jgi:hypothetical protein